MKANLPQPGRRSWASRAGAGVTASVAAGWAALLGALLVSGCAAVPPPPPEPVAPPPIATRPAPPPAPLATRPRPAPPAAGPVDWRDVPLSAGEWHWARESGISTARFGPVGQAPTLALRCDRAAGRIVLRLAAAPFASGPVNRPQAGMNQVSMTIITSTLTRALVANAAASDGGAAPVLGVTLAARDPLLDAMVFSRGRFRIEAEGLPPLTVPSRPEVARVVEDCR